MENMYKYMEKIENGVEMEEVLQEMYLEILRNNENKIKQYRVEKLYDSLIYLYKFKKVDLMETIIENIITIMKNGGDEKTLKMVIKQMKERF